MTVKEFSQSIGALSEDCENRDFEAFLLALLRLVEIEKDQPPTAELMLRLLKEAFTAEPAEFDPEWQSLGPPDDHFLYVHHPPEGEEQDSDWEEPEISETAEYDYTVAVLQFQIGEFHSMRGKQLENPMRYFGLDSDSGNDWYNFDPFTNLECGARCMVDRCRNEAVELPVDWSLLGELLEMGRIYE